ncbi:uncharacterized protein B0H18DRAFT_1122793 [Fomitopsis serialis]|uniref:uncharacterized protein n=1 Tax=Fomitopsis serialis TaxID=139415 RepID=UPI0020085FFE|nr:uncharacterized protein B0H18DRAFT_1122793 [Neoantrodia serialis]KAH9918987.1 hypothetical protein B0H18DRAFT_1122793 [Neoantrodia serialis]
MSLVTTRPALQIAQSFADRALVREWMASRCKFGMVFAEFLRLRASVIPAPSTPSSSAPPAPTIPLQLTNSDAHGLDALLGFIMDCYGVLPHFLEGAKLTKLSSVLQCWCAQNNDKHLPFRELTRGRCAVTSPSGPFHPDNIGKVGAIASGILHRCITFGAKASYLSPNFFPSLEDFKKLIAAHPEDYLCDKSCCGTHQPQRDPQHAEAYFAAEPHFCEFFGAHPVAFMDARQEFLAECRTGAIQRKRLPSSGPLTSTLLAADFAYAGKVKMPTVEEMGEVVWNLKAGVFAGLACLGLISGKSATQDEVCKAFKLAHDHLEAKLSADVKSKIVFDPVMVEHTLCKVKRAGKKVIHELSRPGTRQHDTKFDDRDLDLDNDRDLDLDNDRDIDHDLDRDTDHDLDRDIDHDLDTDHDPDRDTDHDPDRDADRDVDRDLDDDLERHVEHNVDHIENESAISTTISTSTSTVDAIANYDMYYHPQRS